MCDSFLGEGEVGVKSGVQVLLRTACWRNPSLPLRTFQPHPSRWEGIKKGNKFSEKLFISSGNAVVRACSNINYGNKKVWQNPGMANILKHHLPFSAPQLF
jgi:hypothetical protein